MVRSVPGASALGTATAALSSSFRTNPGGQQSKNRRRATASLSKDGESPTGRLARPEASVRSFAGDKRVDQQGECEGKLGKRKNRPFQPPALVSRQFEVDP